MGEINQHQSIFHRCQEDNYIIHEVHSGWMMSWWTLKVKVQRGQVGGIEDQLGGEAETLTGLLQLILTLDKMVPAVALAVEIQVRETGQACDSVIVGSAP